MAFTKGNRGRPKGAINKATREIKDFARNILERPEYVASLARRLDKGDAPHMETLLHHYAYGKPREGMDVSGEITMRWQR
jgi:hypothetical protein